MITEVNLPQNAQNSMNHQLKKQLTQSKFNHKVQALNNTLMNTIYGDIQSQNLRVSQNQKPFKLRKISNKQSKPNMEMSQLITKRNQIQNELKKIKQEERKILLNESHEGLAQSKLSQNLNNKSDRMFRSEITQEQKEKIKEVIRAQRKFIKELKEKQKEFYQYVEQHRIRTIQLDENIKKQKCQQRKKYWESIRTQINQRQQERRVKFQKDEIRLKDVKKSKKLYEVLQKSWKSKLQMDQNLIKEATQHMRLNHKFDINKILEHQNQYEKAAKEKEQLRLKNFQEFQQKVKLSLPKIPQSKFFNLLKQEEKQKKDLQLSKQRRKQELSQKKNQFVKKVRNQFKPKVDEEAKSNNTFSNSAQESKVDKRTGLPLGEIRNLGNDYMKQIHSNVALVKASRGQNSKVSEVENAKKTQYKNYLHDLKQNRNEAQIKANLTNEVSKIMKNTNYSALQKIERAKLVAKRLQSKQNNKSAALISSINEKIKILKVLNEN